MLFNVCDDDKFDIFVGIPWPQLGPTGSLLSVLGSDKTPERVSERDGQIQEDNC